MTWQLRALTIMWTPAPGSSSSCVDGRGDQADDPGQPAGADDGLGLGAVGDDPLDGARDLVAGGEAADGLAGEQDVVGPDLDQQPRCRRAGRGNGTISSGPSSSSEATGVLLGGVVHDPGGEDVADAFARRSSRSVRGGSSPRTSSGGPSATIRPASSRNSREPRAMASAGLCVT